MNLLSDLLAFTARQIAALKAKNDTQDSVVNGINTRVGTAESNITSLTTRFDNTVSANSNSAVTLYNNSTGFFDGTITLAQPITNFDFLDIFYINIGSGSSRGGHSTRIPAVAGTYELRTWDADPPATDFEASIEYGEQVVTISGSTFTAASNKQITFSIASQSSVVVNTGSYRYNITKIVGIKMGSASPAELTDIRVGADNFPYSTAGAAVRTQIGDVATDVNPLINKSAIDIATNEHRGYYIGHNGAIGTTAGTFAYTEPVPVKAGCRYTFTGQGTTIMSAVCSCDSTGGSRTSLFDYNATDVYETKVYEPTADGYIVLCYNYAHGYRLVEQDIVKSLSDYEEAIESTSDKLDDFIGDVSEDNTNIIDMSTIVIGKNWLNQNSAYRAIIDVPVLPNRTYYFFIPEIDKVDKTIQAIQMTASSRANLKASDLHKGETGIITTTSTTYRICIQFSTGSFVATADIFANFEPYACLGEFKTTAIDRSARLNTMPWEDKKLVWLGTSIPAAGKYDIDNPNSYPIMVGEMIGATVYNEAVGSSALHSKDPARINANNPFGFLDNFEAVSRCLTNSAEEQEWIIEHFNDANVFTKNVPSSLSNDDKEFIRSCSWEVKLQKYFTDEAFPDAWIMDHGHNDIPSEASEATYTEKTAMTGTQHNGYYSAGNFVESSKSSYIEYDVTDELFIWISGTFGGWFDMYDIYDSEETNLGYKRNATQTTVTDLMVDVSKATTLRVSNVNTLINTISVKKLKYPTYNSLYSFNGAFDFVVNKILTYNPKARIIMIGEYENQKYPTVSENQIIAANRWEFPLYRQWENLGWSQQPILVDGEYKSMLNIMIPDNLHPHTDTTGHALKHMARNIALWLNTIG